MSNSRRRSLRAAAFVTLAAAIGASAAAAQETNTLGPPQLRDFQLPGQRTTPPAPQPAPTTTPAPSASAPARPAASPPPATPRRATAPLPAARQQPAAARATHSSVAPAPAAAPAAERPSQPVAVAPRTAPPIAPPPPPKAGTPRSPGPAWWWLALPMLLLALGGFLFLRRRRAAETRDASDRASLAGSLHAQWLPEGAEPAPVPAEEPAPAPAPAEAPRAWLELDIVPERAAATDNETIVNYELVLRNAGAATAGNIRIDARMFNAGADGEVAEFFSGPIHAHSGSPHVTVEPGRELRLGSAIAMPKTQVRTIEVQGRAIFVPMIAINVAYDWEGGGGRSSKSWLVGRESETPSAKMGPFRLDLGPRIYRQVGRRDGRLVMV